MSVIRTFFGSSEFYFPSSNFCLAFGFVPCLPFAFTTQLFRFFLCALQLSCSPVSRNNLWRPMYRRNFLIYPNEHLNHCQNRDVTALTGHCSVRLIILLVRVGILMFFHFRRCSTRLTRCSFGMGRAANWKQCCLLAVKNGTTGAIPVLSSSLLNLWEGFSFCSVPVRGWLWKSGSVAFALDPRARRIA